MVSVSVSLCCSWSRFTCNGVGVGVAVPDLLSAGVHSLLAVCLFMVASETEGGERARALSEAHDHYSRTRNVLAERLQRRLRSAGDAGMLPYLA
jgi:hypothetical protein